MFFFARNSREVALGQKLIRANNRLDNIILTFGRAQKEKAERILICQRERATRVFQLGKINIQFFMCELIYLEEGRIDDVSICQDATPATALRELAQRVCVCVCVAHKKGRHN